MENNKLRQRFVKDYALPINIYDERLFNYYIGLYDFFPVDKWEALKAKIDTDYKGNVELWLDYCVAVRNDAIKTVNESESFNKFRNCDLSAYNIDINIGEHSCYNNVTDGCRFVSIDLKKANFQALKYMGVIEDEDYDHFIERFNGDDYIKNSKYLRQVILGNLKPDRQRTIERYMMSLIKTVTDEIMPIGFDLYSLNSDELVYKQNCDRFYGDIKIICGVIESAVRQKFGFEVRADYIEVTKLPIVNVNGSEVEAFVSKNLNTGAEKLKKASTTFYPQIYKLWKGMEIEERDLVLYVNDQLATFNSPLMLDARPKNINNLITK